MTAWADIQEARAQNSEQQDDHWNPFWDLPAAFNTLDAELMCQKKLPITNNA